MKKIVINSEINKFVLILVCIVLSSCNTFNNMSGRYISEKESLFFYRELVLYPDNTYKAYSWIYCLEETCDSGKWFKKDDGRSIQLTSTLPDAMNIPIDAIEEQTTSEGITIIFDRPYTVDGYHRNLLEWELTVDGEKFLLDKDTLLLNSISINNLRLEALKVKNIYNNYFTNPNIKTKVYTVKNKTSNKFTIVLPSYVCDDEDLGIVNIFKASPLNKTIYCRELKKHKCD